MSEPLTLERVREMIAEATRAVGVPQYSSYALRYRVKGEEDSRIQTYTPDRLPELLFRLPI